MGINFTEKYRQIIKDICKELGTYTYQDIINRLPNHKDVPTGHQLSRYVPTVSYHNVISLNPTKYEYHGCTGEKYRLRMMRLREGSPGIKMPIGSIVWPQKPERLGDGYWSIWILERQRGR